MKDVAAILDPEIRINQRILLGLSEALQSVEDWDIHVVTSKSGEGSIQSQLHAIKPNAIVIRKSNPELHRLAEQMNVPYVSILDAPHELGKVPTVLPDEDAIGELAANYLMNMNFNALGIIGYHPQSAFPRLDAFRKMIQTGSQKIYSFDLQHPKNQDHPFPGYGHSENLVDWLHALPKPCAIFAYSDQPAAYIVRCCKQNNIRVPEDVSVLGVDDDPLFCHVISPNLASVHLSYSRLGMEAANILLNWPPDRIRVKVPPTNIVERASCRPPRPESKDVDVALDYLRKNVSDGVKVQDLQKITGLSPHQLIYRFNMATGKTPMECILMQRINVAKRLLADTNQSVTKISKQSGFKSATQFYTAFRKLVGISPTQYRKQFSP